MARDNDRFWGALCIAAGVALVALAAMLLGCTASNPDYRIGLIAPPVRVDSAEAVDAAEPPDLAVVDSAAPPDATQAADAVQLADEATAPDSARAPDLLPAPDLTFPCVPRMDALDGSRQPCGCPGLPCCTGPRYCAGTNEHDDGGLVPDVQVCGRSGRCELCGGVGQACCFQDPQCADGLACSPGNVCI